VASMYCAVGMLSGSFRRKVASARRYVDEAETRARSLKAGIAEKKERLETHRASLETTQREAGRVAFEIASLHQKLGIHADGIQLPRGPGESAH
jgi:chromosome segregation ATPase